MQVTVEQAFVQPVFIPIEITLRIETQAELDVLKTLRLNERGVDTETAKRVHFQIHRALNTL